MKKKKKNLTARKLQLCTLKKSPLKLDGLRGKKKKGNFFFENFKFGNTEVTF